MYLERRHLITLSTIRECGGLPQAAERLHLTPSALSHQLKALEDRVGGRLLVRKRRPLRFSPLGRRLLALADRVLPEMEAAERELARMARGGTGRLHIQIDCHSCIDWLLPGMDAFRDGWPDVDLDLSLAHSFDPLPALLEGEVDLVFTSDPLPRRGIDYRPLFRYESVAVMSRSHPLAGLAHVEPGHFTNETLITYPVAEERLDVYRVFLAPTRLRPAARRTAELTSMIVQLVANGRGIAVLPAWAIHKYLERGDVVARPLGPHGLRATLYVACRSEDAGLEYLQAFVSLACETSLKTLPGIEPCDGAVRELPGSETAASPPADVDSAGGRTG